MNSKDHYHEVVQALNGINPKKLFTLGIELKIEKHKLDKFEVNHPGNVDRFKYDLIDHWLKNDPECTWKKLSEALCKADEANLGHKIRDDYILKEPKDVR